MAGDIQFRGNDVKKMTSAAAVAALACALLGPQIASAKGPVTLDAPAAPALVLAKVPEGKRIEFSAFPWDLQEGRTENPVMTYTQEIPGNEEMGQEPGSITYTVAMDWIEVEKDGDDAATVRFSPDQVVIFDAQGGSEGESMSFEVDVTMPGNEFRFTREGELTKYEGGADGFTMNVDTPEALAEQGGKLRYDVVAEDIAIKGEGTTGMDLSNLAEADARYEYEVGSMTLEFDVMPPPKTDEEIAEIEAMNKEFEEMGLDPISTEPEPPVVGKGTMGRLVATGGIGGGVIEGTNEASDVRFEIAQPMPFEVGMKSMKTDVAFPTAPAEEPQDVRYMFSMEGIELSEGVWAMMDPEEALPRELNRLVVDLGMKMMVMKPLLDPQAMAQSDPMGPPPMMPTAVTINEIAFDGLGLTVDAEGEGDMTGAEGPGGQALISVGGFEDFIKNAQNAGMFGEMEAAMAQGMAAQFGEEKDGKLVFDVKTEDGMIVVNGTPVAPLGGGGMAPPE